MTDTGTPWAHLDQTFAFQEPSNQRNEQNHEEALNDMTRRASIVTTLPLDHEQQCTSQEWQTRYHCRPQQRTHSSQKHTRWLSLDKHHTITSPPIFSQKHKLQNPLTSQALGQSPSQPLYRSKHQSQPSVSSIASSVSSFNIPLGSPNDGGLFTLSSPSRIGSHFAPTTLLRPAQTSASWFSSAAQQPMLPEDASADKSHHIHPSLLTPPESPHLESLSLRMLAPSTHLAQPPLQEPLIHPSPMLRSHGKRDSGSRCWDSTYSQNLLAMIPRSAPQGDAASFFSARSSNSIATSTGRNSRNNSQHDSLSIYSESHTPIDTIRHSTSVTSLSSSTLTPSRLKSSAAVPGKAVRRFVRMAGKVASSAASSAKDAIKGTLHVHSNDSTISMGSHSRGGTPSITVTRPIQSPTLSELPLRPSQSLFNVTVTPAVRPSLATRRQSVSKIRQLTGLDMGALSAVSTTDVSTGHTLRRSRSVAIAEREPLPYTPTSPGFYASDAPNSPDPSPKSTSATTRSIWITSTLDSDDEHEEDGNMNSITAAARVGRGNSPRYDSINTMAAAAENAAAGTLNPSVTSLLGPHPQLTTQPPPVMPTRSKFRQLPCATLPANYQHKLLPPNRQLKLKRYSDPAMAPIIEHPDDTSRVWGYNSSRASSLYSERGRLATNFPDNNSEDMLSSFIPSRPAPVPVRPSGVSPPQSPSMLSAASFPSGASSSMAKIIKYTPTIRLSQSYFDNRASSTSPRSPAFAPVALQSTPAVTPARKKSLPTSVDISNPWPVSPPPRPPPPPPLHSSVIAEVEDGENITEVAEFKLRSRSGRSATLFQNELCDDTSDPLRAPAAALSSAFTIDLSLHSWRRSDGSASESIATSTTTANDDTSITASSASRSSGLSVPSSSAAGSTFDKARTAAIGTFSSASTTCSRHSLHSPLKPPLPPPNCPLPPLPASGRICGPVSASRPMPGSMSLAEYSTIKPHLSTQSTFNEVDEDASAASVAAGKIQQIAPRGDIRLRPTALGRSLSQRENSSHMYVSTTPDMKLAGISVSRSSVPAAASSLQGNNLEVDKWCNDLRSRIHLFSEVEKTVAERPMARIAAQQVKKTAGSVPPPTLKERFPVYGAWPGSVCGLVDGGMI